MNSKNHPQIVQETLQRDLKERHIQLMALGSCIGVGLFLGSASSIEKAGPAVLLAYLFIGIITYIVIRAMGEVTVEYPVSGSFCAHAYQFISPLAGFIAGWNYWYLWIVSCMAEITAVGVYVHMWLPDWPQWITCLLALAIMTGTNLISVAMYGEFEFWFAMIKVFTICILIVSGCGMIFFGLGNGGAAVGLANLTAHGGFMPYGLQGVFGTLLMVMYAFTGMEVIGVTAGEAKNPSRTLASAINKCLVRILLFYVLSLAVIMTIYPWNQLGTQGSPFVMVFDKLGITGAANIINVVVITAALSACNTGIYSASRMLYNQALQQTAPNIFSKVNTKKIPYIGVLISAACMTIVLLWSGLETMGYINPITLPAPATIAATTVSMLKDGSLQQQLLISIIRVLEGYFLACGLGIALGIVIGLSKKMNKMLDLIIQILRPIPPIGWIPLAILWFGIGETSKVFIIFLGGFFVILINVIDGIRQVDYKLIEVAKVLEIPRFRMIATLIIPAALPNIFTGMRVALAACWACVVAAELVASSSGIGYMIMNARQFSMSDVVIVGMLSIGVIGKCMDVALKQVERKITRYEG
jgi:L-asparagine transporter-like permease/ABC-type proline/glycine betaine transport system permease subunit